MIASAAATKDILAALSALRRGPVWKLLDTAVHVYLETLPTDERRILAQFTAKMGGDKGIADETSRSHGR